MNQTIDKRALELHTLLSGMVCTQKNGKGADFYQLNDCSPAIDLLKIARKKNANVYLIGNGGSAAIVSHAKTDLMNVGKIKAITLHESAIMTCLSNDYGYENVFSRQLEILANQDDILIAVSSSGASKNILNAVTIMQNKYAKVITLSGFEDSNPLRRMGDLNYWIDSKNYTLVEIAHLFILHHLADCLKSN